jgi:hypothetical protein
MGTNYYLHQRPDCECCGRSFVPLHIGKSSAGWAFALHVIPEDRIESLDDWRALWGAPGAYIKNEYGERIPIADMELIVTVRNHPRGLRRSDLDGLRCIGYGEGPWDYITGEFS